MRADLLLCVVHYPARYKNITVIPSLVGSKGANPPPPHRSSAASPISPRPLKHVFFLDDSVGPLRRRRRLTRRRRRRRRLSGKRTLGNSSSSSSLKRRGAWRLSGRQRWARGVHGTPKQFPCDCAGIFSVKHKVVECIINRRYTIASFSQERGNK